MSPSSTTSSTNNKSKTSSSSSSCSSPYYTMTQFSLLLPVGIMHTVASHVWIFLTTGGKGSFKSKLAALEKPPLHVERYPWQTTTTTISKRDDSKSDDSSTTGVAIVTGSNTGIGFETARSLVLDHGMTVILACRSRDKAVVAVDKINDELAVAAANHEKQKKKQCCGKAVFVHPLDLSSFDSVREFASVVRSSEYKTIHVLVNNAGRNSVGTAGQSSTEASGELDLLFQSNFLGHYLLTRELLDCLSENARIVNLSSVMHHFCAGNGDLETSSAWKLIAMAGQPPYDTYSLSKLASILFSIELNRRYNGHHDDGPHKKIRSIAVNPGAVNSDIWRSFPRFIIPLFSLVYLNNRQGCRTSVVAAVGELLNDDNKNDSDEPILYLQPYKIPIWCCQSSSSSSSSSKSSILGLPFPPMEMLGPFMGYCPTQPRLFADGGVRAAAALWKTSEELTQATAKSSQ